MLENCIGSLILFEIWLKSNVRNVWGRAMLGDSTVNYSDSDSDICLYIRPS